jgi:hypothetical protein
MASKKMTLIPDTSLKFSIKNVLAIIKMQISFSQKLYTCTVGGVDFDKFFISKL